MSFILGTSTLGAASLGNNFKKFKAKIYDATTGTWKTYKPVIINEITLPSNVVVDENNIPIKTLDKKFLLVNENTPNLTGSFLYYDPIKYIPMIYIIE